MTNVIEAIKGSESEFVRFRTKVTAIWDVPLICLGLLFLGGTYYWGEKTEWQIVTIIGLVVIKHLVFEFRLRRRIHTGTFGEHEDDEPIWRQYVRFRDKLPGRFTNTDYD